MIYTLKTNLDTKALFVDEEEEPDCQLNAMILVDSRTFFNNWLDVSEKPFHQQFDDWLSETMPGRTRLLQRGVHDFNFGDEKLPDGSELLDYCRQVTYVFQQASDLMLFKLTWGGV